nr:Ig-like domain-containing protein [uncultured Duganella sp.]
MISHWIDRFTCTLLALLCAVVLTACGGGGGGSNGGCTTIDPNRDPNLPGCPTTPVTPPTTPTPTLNPTLTLLLTDASGAPTATIAPERPGTLVVLLKDSAGAVVGNALISFSTTDRSGVFLPASATALTDAKGVASITLPVGATAGAFTATASATVAGKAATATLNYSVNLPLPNSPRLILALNDVNGLPISALTPSSPGSLVATVRDANGAAVANTVVSFITTDTSTTLVPSTGTALTNAQGVVQVALPVGTLAGGFTVSATASVAGTPVNGAISYAVSVPNGPPPVQPAPSLTLALQAPDGSTTLSIAPDSPGTLVATLRNAANAPVANAVVSFLTNDRTGSLSPSTALTDANGRATVTLNAGSVAAGYTATASASLNGTALNAATNYAVAFPVLTLSAPVVTPAQLAAGGTASLSTTVLSAGRLYVPAQTISFSSPCAAAGKARIGTPVTSVNGVASTSYTDLGCGSVDPITATLVYNGATITASANLTVLLPTAGQLVFVSALPQNIALKGTGGAGRQESATVTFRVLDGSGNAIVGQTVNFALNTNAGGISVAPASAVTGANGVASTTVQSGTVNTPVRVTASLPGGSISTLSDQLVVSTGVPEQSAFSLSAAIKNVEGGQFNGCPAPAGTLITARLADHFRNPAPDGTAVSFTAESGSIDASCLTGLTQTTLTDGTVITQKGTPGECTVRFCAGNPRPADGRVTILAYALGEESFVDANGNNRYDKDEGFADLGDPFRNDRAITDLNANGGNDAFATGNAVRASGEPYIDTNGNGSWDQGGNGVYNGVLLAPGSGGISNTVHVRQSLVMVLANTTPAITYLDQEAEGGVAPTLALSRCTNGSRFVNNTRTFRFAIRDNNPTVFAPNKRSAHPDDAAWLFDRPGNPLPAGTQIAFTSSNGVILGNTILTVQNTNAADAAAWTYAVQMLSDAIQDVGLNCSNPVSNGALNITITTPSGAVSTASFPVSD